MSRTDYRKQRTSERVAATRARLPQKERDKLERDDKINAVNKQFNEGLAKLQETRREKLNVIWKDWSER